LNIVDLIFARSTAALPAVVSPELQLTFGELKARMNDCAQRMSADPAWPRKNRPRIGLDAPSGADYIALALAILKQNACFVPIPAELTASERAQLAKSTALDAIVFAKSAEDWCIKAVVHDSPPAFDEVALEALNPAFIRFSSGTTGTSKGIVISHETLLGRITAANAGLRIGPEDRVLWVLPMAHHSLRAAPSRGASAAKLWVST
jgi:long-chain acyl-CoA synthetase